MKTTDFFPKTRILRQCLEKSLGQYCNISIFLFFLGSLLKQCIIFEIFLQFSLPPLYTKFKLGKNSECTRPTLFVEWGEGLDLCELENAPETQKCRKTFVNDCSFNEFAGELGNQQRTTLERIDMKLGRFN